MNNQIQYCEQRRAKIEAGSKFCDACGAGLEDTEQPHAKPAGRAPLSGNLIGDSNAALQYDPITGERTTPVTDRSSSGAIVLGFLIGGIAGVILVRSFLLDGLEEIGWRVFWEEFWNGRLMNLGDVLNSSTFWKTFSGFLIGGSAGSAIASRIKNPEKHGSSW